MYIWKSCTKVRAPRRRPSLLRRSLPTYSPPPSPRVPDIKTNMKDEASKGVFKRLKDRGLKAALSAVKDTVRSHHIEAKISDGKLEAWGPVFAMTANMRGQMETWARKKHYSTAELSR